MKTKLLALSLLLILAGMPLRADFDFALQPVSGAISGTAESTIGWGYTLTNNDTDLWLLPADLNADGFARALAMPLFTFPAVAPGASLSVAFQADIDGLYQITWDADAPSGWTEYGFFRLNFDWWAGDPLNGGSFDSYAGYRELPYSAEVTAVPEPGAALLLFTAMIVVFSSRRLHLRGNQTGGIK
ncbi:MAG: PEP-CTERM sorting domain-containing protein [Candidatus Solibacter sp.]|nr:PEP-CTERM sorting domain-containing protein [Candidatus Solibacter sp.]